MSSMHIAHSTDGSFVVHLAVVSIWGSCRAIGIYNVLLELTHDKITYRAHKAADSFQKAEGLVKLYEEANGNRIVNFIRHHMPQCPFHLICVPCPKGAITVYYTYLHFMTPLNPPPSCPPAHANCYWKHPGLPYIIPEQRVRLCNLANHQ